mgnify:CR=1 FL=1
MCDILVVGFKEKDSGKTMLTQALIWYLREKGINVCGFKPRAGNNLWYDYDVVYETLSKGRLYGKDAKVLRETSRTSLPEEIINPIHRLWVENSTYTPMGRLPGFLVDRVTTSEHAEFLVVVNKLTLEKYLECKWMIEKLCSNAVEVVKIDKLKELNRIIIESYDKAISLAYRKIKQNHEVVVIESYSNTALPFNNIKGLKAVLGVEPWHIYLYSPDKYLTAVKLLTQLRKNTEITTDQIKQLLKPVKEVKVAPSISIEIVKNLKEKIKDLLIDISL